MRCLHAVRTAKEELARKGTHKKRRQVKRSVAMHIRSAFFLLTFACVEILSQEDDTEEILVDEFTNERGKQNVLFNQNYNSSFTISIPMLTVTVPGTSRINGIIRMSVSHITLWTLVSAGLLGLVYPVLIGPHGKLTQRSFEGRGIEASLLDHIESVVNVSQIYEDVRSVFPESATTQCLRKTVCEAHEHAEHFGIAGLTLRSAYPPAEFNVFGAGVESELRQAAEYGSHSEYSCEEIYSACMLSPVEVYREAAEYLMRSLFDEENFVR